MSQQDDNNDNQKVLFGFVLGAVTGAAAALLLNPTATEEARKKVAEKAGPLKDLVNNNLDTLVHYGLGMLKSYAGSASKGDASPIQAVVKAVASQAIAGLVGSAAGAEDKKARDKGDKASKKEGKEGKKKSKKEDRDEV
jgi:gas vesicle protein